MPDHNLRRLTLASLRYASGGMVTPGIAGPEDPDDPTIWHGPIHPGNAGKITLDRDTVSREMMGQPTLQIKPRRQYVPTPPPAPAAPAQGLGQLADDAAPGTNPDQNPYADVHTPDASPQDVFSQITPQGPVGAVQGLAQAISQKAGLAQTAAPSQGLGPSTLEEVAMSGVPKNKYELAAQLAAPLLGMGIKVGRGVLRNPGELAEAIKAGQPPPPADIPAPRVTVTNAAGIEVPGTMGGAKGNIYAPLPEDVEALAAKINPADPKAGRALRQAAATLRWNNYDKPAAEADYGPLVQSSPTDLKLLRLQNTPERIQQRIQEARDLLDQPTDPWAPKDYGIFDRSLINQSMNGFPDVAQTPFPRSQPMRADISHIDEMYTDPVNRELIKRMIARGLPLGGGTFYQSLYPVKAEAMSRDLTSPYFPQTGGDLFNNWVYSVAPGSARNSIYNERAVGNFLRDLYVRGIPIAPINMKLHNPDVIREMAAFQQRNGMGLPLMPVHAAGAARVLEQGISPLDVLNGNLTDSYKIPTYSVQQTGNFAHSWTGDVHEAKGESWGTRFHPWFADQGQFGVNEYGRAEQYMRGIAQEMGLPTGTAQAGRWFGGGELTGLMSPRGDSLDLLERQAAYTLHAQGQPTDAASVRNYVMRLIQQGGDLLPWAEKTEMPDHRMR